MNRFLKILAISILFSSCAGSPNDSKWNEGNKWLFYIETEDLEKHQIFSLTQKDIARRDKARQSNDEKKLQKEEMLRHKEMLKEDKDLYRDIQPFGKINVLYSLLETLNLLETMNIQSQIELMDALFNHIPKEPIKSYYRTTAIGKAVDNENLVLSSINFSPNEKAPKNTSVIYVLQSSVVIMNKEGGTFIMNVPKTITADHWSLITLIFDDGRIIASKARANIDKYKRLLNKGDATSLLNLTDFYLKDEIITNDAEVPNLIKRGRELAEDDQGLLLLADLNDFLYLVSRQNLAEAEKLLAKIQATSEYPNKRYKAIATIQAPNILALMKHLVK